MEATAEGHHSGDIVRVRLLPDDAFSRRNTDLLHEAPLSATPPGEDIKVGATLIARDEHDQAASFRITAFNGDSLSLDANHPLASKTLIFEIEAQDIRAASPQEIEQASSLVQSLGE